MPLGHYSHQKLYSYSFFLPLLFSFVSAFSHNFDIHLVLVRDLNTKDHEPAMLRSDLLLFVGALASCIAPTLSQCPDYTTYSAEPHGPFSSGSYNLSYQRPPVECRNFTSPLVESTISRLNSTIADPDLFRLFENAFPNTLDTTVAWRGYAANSTEELAFVITGDIDAMWLRDSANQMQSYLPLLNASAANDSLASLYRGVINLQARYILLDPWCNSYDPPVESGLPPQVNGNGVPDTVTPPYTNTSVFECKFELDSLAAFLEISTNYYQATHDISFFQKYSWVNAIETIMTVVESMMIGTYAANGSVNTSPYTFERDTTSGSGTLANNGLGNPTQEGTGLIRSAFRPSDDATIYQLFIPANMMFSRYIGSAAAIMQNIGGMDTLASQMQNLSTSLQAAISKYGIISDPNYGSIYAFEIDGFGSRNLMDDANIPSLLAAPVYGYLNANDSVYQATRKFVLSSNNPYFMRGPVINSYVTFQ